MTMNPFLRVAQGREGTGFVTADGGVEETQESRTFEIRSESQ